jgi:hypothetical protein
MQTSDLRRTQGYCTRTAEQDGISRLSTNTDVIGAAIKLRIIDESTGMPGNRFNFE